LTLTGLSLRLRYSCKHRWYGLNALVVGSSGLGVDKSDKLSVAAASGVLRISEANGGHSFCECPAWSFPIPIYILHNLV